MGELSALEWLASIGAHVYIPLGHSPDVDLIADLGGRLIRVEAKTSSNRNDRDRWDVAICTRGGNQSWSGIVKRFDADRCDYLFIHVGDGRRWFIPTRELDARSGVTLGGPKYAEFEVDPGRPLRPEMKGGQLQSPGPGEYPSGQRGGAVNAMALPSQVRILPPPSVDRPDEARTNRVGRTRLSANHQLTIPQGPFEDAGLEVGDRFRVKAEGPGQLTLTRLTEYSEMHRLQLSLDSDEAE